MREVRHHAYSFVDMIKANSDYRLNLQTEYTIEEVAQVTGHRNLNILWQVYTQLFPHKLHDKFS